MIRFRIKNVISNRWLRIECVILIFLLFRTLWPHFILNPIPPEYDMLSVITQPLSLSAVSPFASAFCSFPVSWIFTDEYVDGFSKSALLRTTHSNYIRGILLETLLIGSMTIAVPYMFLFLFAMIKAGPSSSITLSDYYRDTIWQTMALYNGGYPVLIGKLLLAILFGWVWALMGLITSAISLNRYVGAIVPFIICQTLWAVLENSKWNPVYLLNGNGPYWNSIGEIVAIQLSFCVILAIAANRLLRWRCKSV